MKKVFGQTVRDIKREVNKKVLKVHSIEQKVLDATSNDPWGPHGLLLADIAQATRNFHEYQRIMAVIWKRIGDNRKNWRHVYKALIVLEYLVAHGSERVIDEIREHSYQLSILLDFQYIDSSGKDQGHNVRKKSQDLVVLVSDKEKIQEIRQKPAANMDKYHNPSTGGMYQTGSHSNAGGYGNRYDGDLNEARFGSREDERNDYGREREWGHRDDDRNGKYGDSYGHDGDKYSRGNEERCGRDGYRDDDYDERSRSNDDHQNGSRSRSVDRDGDRAYEYDGQSSSRRHDHKYSEQNIGAPPSYEEAVGTACSPTHSERDGELSAVPKVSSPPSPSHVTTAAPPPAPDNNNTEVDGFGEFDPRGSFSATPTSSNAAVPTTSGGVAMDLLGAFSKPCSSNSLALIPAEQAMATSEANTSPHSTSVPTSAPTSSPFTVNDQSFDDPFGDGPFKAIPSTDNVPDQQQITTSTYSFDHIHNQNHNVPQPVLQMAGNDFGDNFHGTTYMSAGHSGMQLPTTTQSQQQEMSNPYQDVDILADILPPSGVSPLAISHTDYPVPANQPVSPTGFPPQANTESQLGLLALPIQTGPQTGFQAQTGQPASMTAFPGQPGQYPVQTNYPLQSGQPVSQTGFLAQTNQPLALTFPSQPGQTLQMGFPTDVSQPAGFPSQMGSLQARFRAPFGGQFPQPNANLYAGYHPQMGSTGAAPFHTVPQMSNVPVAQNNFLSQSDSPTPVASLMGSQAPQAKPSSPIKSAPQASSVSAAIVPQSSNDKFETKSTVWADTLSRGLVNLNISGPKTNPLSDIGVDFDAINRKEKRMEKPTTTTVVSNVTMGKAMGSGSGIGRAGASALRHPPNQIMGSIMGSGMINDIGSGIGMGGYLGGVNKPMGMGMGMNRPGNMGMGMDMGMGQGVYMQQQPGFPSGTPMPGAYNPMMGTGNPGAYNPMMGTGNYGQQPYSGGYR